MVKAKTPWHALQCSPGKLPDLKCMSTLLETRQQRVCLPSAKEVGSFKFPGSSDPQPPSSRTEPSNEARFPTQSPKGFLVFDRSENRTRMIFNYLCPSAPNPENRTANDERPYRESSESNTNGESEMHEDTEEINALLDSEDDESDEDDEEDEVTSTCRSPTPTKRVREKDEPTIEGVASSDGPNKKQKKLDGSHHEYDDDDVKSSYDDGPSGFEGSKKDNIRRILRILESIIPGVKGKDPLLVIDEAIDYLSVAKIKAETLGVSSH